MTGEELAQARADIETTGDLLERAMKLSGLVTTLFQERGFPLVVVGGGCRLFPLAKHPDLLLRAEGVGVRD